MFNISMSGDTNAIKKLIAKMQAAEASIPTHIQILAEQVGVTVSTALSDQAPVRTGALAASFNHEVAFAGENAEVTFTSDVPYANFVDLGHNTRPGPNQHWVEAQDFTGKALQEAEPMIDQDLALTGQMIIDEFKV